MKYGKGINIKVLFEIHYVEVVILFFHFSNETLHQLAAYLNLVPKRQEEVEGDEEVIDNSLLVELLVRMIKLWELLLLFFLLSLALLLSLKFSLL